MWGVSRTTLRQAVDTLVGRGVLYRVNGAGVYVSVGKKNRNMVGVDSMVGELRQQGSILAKKIISVRKVEELNRFLRNFMFCSDKRFMSIFFLEK